MMYSIREVVSKGGQCVRKIMCDGWYMCVVEERDSVTPTATKLLILPIQCTK